MAQQEVGRTRVPVANRREKTPRRTKRVTASSLLDMSVLTTLLVIALLFLVFIQQPLRNYFSGRAEIARLTESIAVKEETKQELLDGLARYGDDAYVEQEARRRLGLVKEGEAAYRIVDPRLSTSDQLTTSASDAAAATPWYEVLWDTIATKPVEVAPPVDQPSPPADGGIQ